MVDARRIGPTFSAELTAAGCAGFVAQWGPDGTIVYMPSTGPDDIAAVERVVASHDPTRAPAPYLTGEDVIDGLSPAQAKAPGVDPRDLVRIQGAPMASMVKSKIARVAKANGTTAEAVLAQAVPTGGT